MKRTLTTLLILALPALAAAQVVAPGSAQLSEVRSSARGHVGPFYLTPSLVLTDLGVDNNVFNAAGEPVSDFTFTLRPSLKLWVPVSRRAMLRGTAAPDLVWYTEHASERSVNPQVSARGELYVSRFTLFGERTYVNSRQRSNYEIDLRARAVQHTSAAGVAVAVTSRLSLETAAREVEVRYDADAEGGGLARTLNRRTRGGQLTARHKLTPLTTLALRAEVLEDRFPLLPTRDSESYRVMPGVEFAPQALLKGTAYVGHRRFTPAVPGSLPPFSGLVADLGLSYTLLGSTVFGVSYRRDLAYSFSELQPFFVDNGVGVSIRRALGRRLDLLVSGDRHAYDYRNALDSGLPGTRQDITWLYAASLGYRVGKDGRVGFGVSHVERESTEPSRAYRNLRFGTTVSYGF